MSGAFVRSRALGAYIKKYDVPMQYTNWWKKLHPVEAEVTQHLSSHEQNILLPWIKTFPKKLVDRAPVWAWPIGTMAAVYAIASYVDSLDYAEDLEHRF